MLSAIQREEIISLIKREVVPAIGCTEPIAVALCTARAVELLGCRPERINARLSASIIRNAMGVGIPGTGGMVGLPIAIALGALTGHSELGLELLQGVTDESVKQGCDYIDEGRINIELKGGDCPMLYIEVEVEAEGVKSIATIANKHTQFTYLKRGDEILLDELSNQHKERSHNKAPELDMRTVWDFAMTTPTAELEFILESGRMNLTAAKCSLQGDYGHCVGRVLGSQGQGSILGDSLFLNMLSMTSAACDARMAGEKIPVMSNSGSGNQGIAATVPVVVYANGINANEEQLVRALTLSHLTVIYIKQSLGRLSALCGCVVAATGSSCAIAYLMGGDWEHIVGAVKNMVANLAGMICDGAKPSCSMKLSSGVSSALISAIMAINGHSATALEGIISDDVDESIRNLTSIGSKGMEQTNSLVINIMTNQ